MFSTPIRSRSCDAEIVLHELDEHVALPVIARQQTLLRPPALCEDRAFEIGEIHLLQPVRDPRRLVLDRADPEAGKLVEHAGEHHRAERIAHPVIGRRAPGAGQFGHVHRELVGRNPVARRADMQQQRMLEFLGNSPETVISRVAVRLVPVRRDRDERADQAHFGDAFEFGGALVGVIDVEHRDALQPVRVGLQKSAIQSL